jgi:DNA-binding response OmpR family regulator
MDNKNKSILIVEDDLNISRALSIRLKSAGYSVECAYDALSAPKMAKHILPDMLLLDVALPGGDGFQVAQKIDDMKLGKEIKKIYLTASKKPGLWKRVVETHANGFIEKPFDSADLLDQIDNAFRYNEPLHMINNNK